MSITYTTNAAFEKPTVGNSLNVWGTELNKTLDLIDSAIFSNNFAENTLGHSGLNFAYKNGRVADGTTITNVAGSTVLLTDNNTNYVEVSVAGVVSANTTGFSNEAIPLFTVITASGVISTTTDKRAYMTSNYQSIDNLTGDIIKIDANNNILINGAAAGTSAEKSLNLLQGVDPTTSPADQISIFATSGSNSTLGLRTEQSVSNDLLRIKHNGVEKYIHMRETELNPLTDFLTGTQTVENTTSEELMIYTVIPGRASPGGQLLHCQLATILNTAAAADQATIRFKVGADVFSIYSNTSGTHTNNRGWINFYVYIKDTVNYAYNMRAAFGGYTWTGAYDYSEVFTSDLVIQVTIQFNNANIGSSVDLIGGCMKFYN